MTVAFITLTVIFVGMIAASAWASARLDAPVQAQMGKNFDAESC